MLRAQIQQMLYLLRTFKVFICLAVKCYIDMFEKFFIHFHPFPSPGDLPDPGIEPGSPTLQADALPSEPPGTRTV